MALVLIVLIPLPLEASEVRPFQTQNQSPLVQIFGLPAPQGAAILPRGKARVRIGADIASHYASDSTPRENILLDGESYRFTLEGHYGIGRGVEVGLELPYVVYGGGFLDGLIDTWHRAFGFPEGGRNQAPRNRLLFLYQSRQKDRLRIDRPNSGIGDLRLQTGLQIYESPEGGGSQLSLRASLKLPTGDPDFLHGSGSTDLALWAIGSQEFPWKYGSGVLWGWAGMLGMTTGRVLPDQQRNLVGFGGLGVGYRPFSWMALKVQTNAHGHFFKESELRELAFSSIQLSLGGSVSLSEKISLDIGITEDLIVKTSPDVVFLLALIGRF